MGGIKFLSDDELERIANKQSPLPKGGGFSHLSDDELEAIANGGKPKAPVASMSTLGKNFLTGAFTDHPESESSGALGALSDLPQTIRHNIGKTFSDLKSGGIGGLLGGIGEAASDIPGTYMSMQKGMWDFTIGNLNRAENLTTDWVADLIAPNRSDVNRTSMNMSDPLSMMVNAYNPDAGKNLTAEDRYKATAPLLSAGLGLVTGAALSKGLEAFGVAANLSKMQAIAELPEAASMEEILRVADHLDPKVSMKLAANVSHPSVLSKMLIEGGMGGAAMGLGDPELRNSPNAAKDLFMLGLGGAVFAGFGEFNKGKSPINGVKKSLAVSAVNAGYDIWHPKAYAELAMNVAGNNAPSIIRDVSRALRRDSRILLDLPEGAELPTTETSATYRDPKTGKRLTMIVGEGIVEAEAAQAKDYVLDSKGQPLKLYHGTSNVFDKIEPMPSVGGTGIFLTDNGRSTSVERGADVSDFFALQGENPSRRGPAPQTRQYHLALTEPQILTIDVHQTVQGFAQQAINGGRFIQSIGGMDNLPRFVQAAEQVSAKIGDGGELHAVFRDMLENPTKAAQARIPIDNIGDLAKAAGYKALRLSDIYGAEAPAHIHNEYMVFDPKDLVDPAHLGVGPSGLSKSALNSFSKSGFYRGMELEIDGRVYAAESRFKDGDVKVKDILTGESQKVNPERITRRPTGKIFDIETLEAQRSVPTEAKNWDESVSPEMRNQLDAITADASRQLTGVPKVMLHDLLNRGYYLNAAKDGSLWMQHLTDESVKVPIPAGPDGLATVRGNILASSSAPELIKNVQDKLLPDMKNGNGVNLTSEGIIRGKRVGVLDLIRQKTSAAIPKRSMIESMDRLAGSKILPAYDNIIDLIKQQHAQREPFAVLANQMLDRYNMFDEVQRSAATGWFEAMGQAEFDRNGLFGEAPNESELGYINSLIESKTTPEARQRANQYSTDLAAVEKKYGQIQSQPKLMAKMTEIRELGKHYNIIDDPIATKAAEIIQQVRGDESANLMTVLKGADVGQPGSIALDRIEFAKAAKLTPEFVRTLTELDGLFHLVGKEAGVSGRMLTHYFPHYARYNPKWLGAESVFGDRSTPPDVRGFASELTRTGYFNQDQRITNMSDVVGRYINGAFSAKYVDAGLSRLKKAIDVQLQQLTTDANGNRMTKLEPGMRTVLLDLYDRAERSAKHYTEPSEALARVNADVYLNHLNPNAPNKSYANTWQRFMEMKYQGGKVTAGLRDMLAVPQMINAVLGPKRAASWMKTFVTSFEWTEAKKRAEAGVTPHLGVTQLGGGSDPAVIGQAASTFNKVSDWSFKASLQPQMYMLAHDIAYKETTATVGHELAKLQNKTITPKQFNENIGLSYYDDATVEQFQGLVKAGQFTGEGGAIDYLARRTGRLVVGEYSSMTSSAFYENRAGKFLGRFGQWGLWALDNTANALTKSTKTGAITRIGGIAAGMYAAKKFADQTGLDYMSWMLSPTSLLPSGSPELSEIMNISKSGDLGSYGDMSRALALKGAASLANPLPMQIQNIYNASRRYQNGDDLPVMLQQLFGQKIDVNLYPRPESIWDDYF